MKKYKLGFLFTQPPFGSAVSREGLDALLAASAFCDEDDILICFLGNGVFNLIENQKPNEILQKDHIATFKLIDLYDLKQCFVCKTSLEQRQLQNHSFILQNIQKITQLEIFNKLKQAEKILTF